MEKELININTTINKELYKNLRILSKIALNKHIYELIEEGCQYLIDNAETILQNGKWEIKSSLKSNRRNVSTLMDKDLYQNIQLLALKMNLNTNDLIEESVRYVLTIYKDQMPGL